MISTPSRGAAKNAAVENTPRGRRKDRDFVSSLERGLMILGVFDREDPELTLSEVAHKTGLTPATARRFLLTLKSLGYMGTNGRRFVLRPKVLDLAYSYLDSMNADEALQPYLREIVQRTGDSSSVTVLAGTEIVYVANSSVRRLVRLSATVGSRFPAYPTAMGRVLLAHLPPAQLASYFKVERFDKITEFTETNPDKLRKILDTVRQQDYCVVQDELEVGLVSLSVPLRDGAGHVIAAMNCSSVARRTDSQEMLRTRLDLLREYAATVSTALRRFPAFAHSVASGTNGEFLSDHPDPLFPRRSLVR
jgi:IclR family transcriptional regulator, pca regulon regulatory protein